jgi:primosomal protein N' (replication factor Y)
VIARVEPLTTTRRLAGPFDYALPDGPVEVGSIVRVPFGRQALDGVVVGLAATSDVPADRLVTPTAVREDSLPPELVALALWMADEYCSTPARALQLVLPPAGRPRTELWGERTAAPLDGARLTDRQRALLASLPRAAGGDLPALRRLESRGLVAVAPRARRRAPLVAHGPDPGVVLTPEQAAALAAALAERGVLVWEADGRVRYSAHLYNDGEDVERAIEASRHAVATLGG